MAKLTLNEQAQEIIRIAEHKNEFWEEIKKRWDEDVQDRRK